MRACAAPGALGSAERAAIPSRWFGLPERRGYPLARIVGGRAVPSASHARNALGRAAQQLGDGNLTPAQYARIVAAAESVIEECSTMAARKKTTTKRRTRPAKKSTTKKRGTKKATKKKATKVRKKATAKKRPAKKRTAKKKTTTKRTRTTAAKRPSTTTRRRRKQSTMGLESAIAQCETRSVLGI
jgi:hypothetical protein